MDYQVVLSPSPRRDLRDIVRYISVDAPDRAMVFGRFLISQKCSSPVVGLAMRKILPLMLGVLCLGGCVNKPQTLGLSEKQRRDLVIAVHEWASSPRATIPGSERDWPAEIRRLKPLAVYSHSANIVIVLSRNAQEERGYYIVPTVSSYVPNSFGPEWKWKPISVGDSLWQGQFYEYVRARMSLTNRCRAQAMRLLIGTWKVLNRGKD